MVGDGKRREGGVQYPSPPRHPENFITSIVRPPLSPLSPPPLFSSPSPFHLLASSPPNPFSTRMRGEKRNRSWGKVEGSKIYTWGNQERGAFDEKCNRNNYPFFFFWLSQRTVSAMTFSGYDEKGCCDWDGLCRSWEKL